MSGLALIDQTGITCPLLNKLLQPEGSRNTEGPPWIWGTSLPLLSLRGWEGHQCTRRGPSCTMLLSVNSGAFHAGNIKHSEEAQGKEMLVPLRAWTVREGFLGEACLQTVKGDIGRVWQAEGTGQDQRACVT